MSWLFDEKPIIAQAVSEIRYAFLTVCPELKDLISTSDSPAELGRSLGQVFQSKAKQSGDVVEALQHSLRVERWQRETAERQNQFHLQNPLIERVRYLEEQMTGLKSNLTVAQQENKQLGLQVSNLIAIKASLEATIADLNRLVARQHQQLVDLLGNDFNHP